MTPLSTQAARDLGLPPLLVLHLLEWQDWQGAPVPDVAELSRAFRELQGARAWSQLIIKETHDQPPSDTVPASGIWAIDAAGEAGPIRSVFDTGALAGDHEAMVLRTIGPGNARDKGTVIARLMGPGRMMNNCFELEPRARAWISSVRARFEG